MASRGPRVQVCVSEDIAAGTASVEVKIGNQVAELSYDDLHALIVALQRAKARIEPSD